MGRNVKKKFWMYLFMMNLKRKDFVSSSEGNERILIEGINYTHLAAHDFHHIDNLNSID